MSKFPYKFKDENFLKTALTHRSYLNEHKDLPLESNERLEYLGDAVLELITSLYLFKKYPDFTEGKLTNLRSKIVQTHTLSLAAQKLDLDSMLKMSRGEMQSQGNRNPSILANTFEAVIGAIYLDAGFKAAFRFVEKNLFSLIEKHLKDSLPEDYKSTLQEIVQARGFESPDYKTLAEYGPDHNKKFKVAVFVGNKQVTFGIGKSKQQAEQVAAKKALEKIREK